LDKNNKEEKEKKCIVSRFSLLAKISIISGLSPKCFVN
jgi:hypothetical protein